MASNYQLFVALAIVAIALPTMALATDFVVGGDDGWKPGVNYTIWASDKVFHVGDRLVFTYEAGKHNVIKVDLDNFKTCNASGVTLTTGNDTIPLLATGKKWYICGFTGHCTAGQKLVINVQNQAPAPAPNSAPNVAYSWPQVAAVLAMAVAAILVAV